MEGEAERQLLIHLSRETLKAIKISILRKAGLKGPKRKGLETDPKEGWRKPQRPLEIP